MRAQLFSVLAACALVGSACGSKPKQTTTPETKVREHGGDRGGPAVASRGETGKGEDTPPDPAAPRFDPIYFEFDEATLTPEARENLERVGSYLRRNAGATVTIGGHADERGTPEYNQALGEERARAARDYLVRLGVESSRIQVVSYGEERPAVDRSDESAWSKNRRDEFEVRVSRAASR